MPDRGVRPPVGDTRGHTSGSPPHRGNFARSTLERAAIRTYSRVERAYYELSGTVPGTAGMVCHDTGG